MGEQGSRAWLPRIVSEPALQLEAGSLRQEARRLSSLSQETRFPEIAERLQRLAGDLLQRADELDRPGCA
jgi:hypothetical protein